MTARDLLGRLRSLGFEIAASNGRLRVTADRGELTEELRQAILRHKPELLALLAKPEESLQPPCPIARDRPLPLSSFQTRLWVLHQLEPDSTAYNIAASWRHGQARDAAAIEALIRTVLKDNEILRATFRDDGVEPSLDPVPPEAIPLALRDLRGLSGSDQDAVIRADRTAQCRTPFKLSSEASTRWTLYRVAETCWTILVIAHHIAIDQWSLTLLRQRIEEPLAHTPGPSALQYVDCAAWLRRAQDALVIRDELSWWEKRLSGIPHISSFPADQTSAGKRGANGATREFCLDAGLVSDLRKLIRQQGVTLYSALLAVFAAILRAHAGHDAITIGSPLGVRDRPEFETVIGPFVNLLVLRFDLDDDPSFAELLTRARDAFLDSYDHRQVPFDALVDRLRPPRSYDRAPLCQTAVVLHNASDADRALVVEAGGSSLDVTWYAREFEERVEGSVEYRTDLYSDAAIERIVGHLEAFLRAGLREPTRPISEISLLTADERDLLLREFNQTAREVDPVSVVAGFERQAAEQPERVAVTYDGETLNYGELNRRANQLARHLQARRGGSPVGIAVERSPDMVVALLAAQKAGATYVPLDPRFPADRLQFMLADSGIGVLIASHETTGRFDLPGGVETIDLADAGLFLDGLDASDLATKPAGEDIAYIIYTSGSTGQPNGVAVSQAALANFISAMREQPGLSPDDCVAAVTTISFDIAALELYLPLVIGARIELVSRDVAADGVALAEVLARSGATVMQATPSSWRLLIEAGWRARPGFRALCGGEAMPRDLADLLLENVEELWNLYGPTETTVWSTAGRVGPGGEISIGQPIANTSVYVLDPEQTPTALGTPGEIWIGGAGVAAGYHNRPELTAARFVSDPFAGRRGARMYRTGDLGRWGADGRLYHLGRLDRQVKLHGYRIELEEIEAALRAHPAVARAVVVARNVTPEQPKLIAYVVYHSGRGLTATEARRHVKKTLPDYMAPSAFVELDAMPLTPNGKTDVGALPDPFRNSADPHQDYEPPAPGLEQLIAGVWKELLQLNRVGAEDNFFELGGNSLLSLRAVAMIEAQAGCRLQPRILFFQNLRQLATAARVAGATLVLSS